MTTIAIGDGHPLFADLLGSVLVARGFDVVHVAVAAQPFVEGVRRWRPDVCLVDHRSLAGRHRGLLVERIRGVAGMPTKVVVLSSGPLGPAADTPDGLGVDGVLDKRANLSHLLDGLRRVLEGERIAGPPVLVDRRPTGEAERLHRLAVDLTPRERECLALIVDGRTTGHIGSTLSISVTTVRTHVRSLLRKLGAHSRLEAASLAMRYDLLGDDLEASWAG